MRGSAPSVGDVYVLGDGTVALVTARRSAADAVVLVLDAASPSVWVTGRVVTVHSSSWLWTTALRVC